jgi:hypothetical protein
MTQEQKDILWLLLRLGFWGTVISIPIGMWAIPKWRDKPIIPALILTGAGLALKEVMISGAEHGEPLRSELAGAPVRINPYR